MTSKIPQHAWWNHLFLLWSSKIWQTSLPDVTESFNLHDLLNTFVVLLNDRFKWYFIKYIENAIRRKRQVKDRQQMKAALRYKRARLTEINKQI